MDKSSGSLIIKFSGKETLNLNVLTNTVFILLVINNKSNLI